MKGILTISLRRGYLQYFLSGNEVSWTDFFIERYNLSIENYAELYKEVMNNYYYSSVRDTILHNLKMIYKISVKYHYEFENNETFLVRSKPFYIDEKIFCCKQNIPQRTKRKYNFMTVDSAIKSYESGVQVECLADEQGCQYSMI